MGLLPRRPPTTTTHKQTKIGLLVLTFVKISLEGVFFSDVFDGVGGRGRWRCGRNDDLVLLPGDGVGQLQLLTARQNSLHLNLVLGGREEKVDVRGWEKIETKILLVPLRLDSLP